MHTLGVGSALRLVALLLLSCSLSSTHALSVAPVTDRIVFSHANSPGRLKSAAQAFVKAYWDNGKQPLPKSLVKELTQQHYDDMQNRYADLVGARRLQSRLILGMDESVDQNILGMVGCEMALIDVAGEQVLSRRKGEAMFKDRLNSMGAIQRNKLRRAPLSELTAALFPGNYHLAAVLSNLAISPNYRRRGLAKSLCSQVESVAESWSDVGGRLLLQVEAMNIPAMELYASLGFEELWRDEESSATRVVVQGESPCIVSVPTTLICMGKSL